MTANPELLPKISIGELAALKGSDGASARSQSKRNQHQAADSTAVGGDGSGMVNAITSLKKASQKRQSFISTASGLSASRRSQSTNRDIP